MHKKTALIDPIKAVFLLVFTKLSGRSDWTRTSGLLGPEAVRKGVEPFHKRLFGAFQSGFRAKPRGQSAFVSTNSMRCFSRMGQVMGQIFAMQIKAILKCPLGQMNGSTITPDRYRNWNGYKRTNKREKVYKSRLAPHLI